jgi:hypothetical protein
MNFFKTNLEEKLVDYFTWKDGDHHLDFERLSKGLLNPRDRQSAETHLAECAECREIYDAFLNVHDIWQNDETSDSVQHQTRPSRRQQLWKPLAIAASIALLIGMAQLWYRPSAPADGGAILISKGADRPLLHVAVKRQGRAFEFQSGSKLQKGDKLGFFYSTSTAGYLTVLFGEHQGRFVQLVPAGSKDALSVAAGNEQRLPDGALVSDGQQCEWIIGVFSEQPFLVSDALSVARRMWKSRKRCTLGRVDDSRYQIHVVEVAR